MKRSVFILVFTGILMIAAPLRGSAEAALAEVAGKVDARIEWDPRRQCGIITRGLKRISFKPGNSWLLLDYAKQSEGRIYFDETGTLLASREAERAIEEFFVRPSTDGAPRVEAILIDPGHGGRDAGAIGTHVIDGKKLVLNEKDIVLDVGIDVYRSLKRKYPDKTILLTRSGDSYPTLEERVAMANAIELGKEDAIIYLSIHANASLNTKANGFEVWYLPPDYRRTLIDQDSIDAESEEVLPILNTMLEEEYTTESILLAQRVIDSLEREVGDKSPNRGLKEEIWFVVRKAKMPSILIELGFVTNPGEAVLMSEPMYLQKLSKAIYNGVSGFIEDFERTKGFTE
ncbi:MAG: N-acetylmuramoyl-L-alanine amidase [Spirochaetia bacterium]